MLLSRCSGTIGGTIGGRLLPFRPQFSRPWIASPRSDRMALTQLRALLFGASKSDECSQECVACPAEPATVTPHAYHVLLRLAPPEGAAAGAPADTWWPDRVDE
jgi:hypothetical protein